MLPQTLADVRVRVLEDEGGAEADDFDSRCQASPLLWFVPCASVPPGCTICDCGIQWETLERDAMAVLSLGAGGGLLSLCATCARKSFCG